MFETINPEVDRARRNRKAGPGECACTCPACFDAECGDCSDLDCKDENCECSHASLSDAERAERDRLKVFADRAQRAEHRPLHL